MVRPLSLASVSTLMLVSSAASAAPKAPPKPPAAKKVITVRRKVVENIVPVAVDYEGDAAKRLSAAFAKGDRARVVRELGVPLDYEKLHTDDERCTRRFGAKGMVMREADLDEFARCILLTVEFAEDAEVIPHDRHRDSLREESASDEENVTRIKIDPKTHKVVEITAGHHQGQAAGAVYIPH